MPKRTIDYCIDIIRYFRERGLKMVKTADLQEIIAIKCGALPQTRSRYMKAMQEFRLVEKAEGGEWFINYDRAEELMM